MKIYIKNMVSLRCIIFVQQELKKLQLCYINVNLGTIELKSAISDKQKEELRSNLAVSGLELMDDKKNILIDKIKNVIIEMIHYGDELIKVNYSDYIADQLNYDYKYLSNLFSEVKGITIQHFIIKHKIEKAKELILYNELNLTEIAHKLHYSSLAHLSYQFKKVTGHTPSYFKKIGLKRKQNLENL